jgi:hypothetical protein
MSEINEALRAIHIGHVLQPAWNTFEPRESGYNFVSLSRRGHDQASRNQRILNLECPEQREVNFVLGAIDVEHKVLAAAPPSHFEETNVLAPSAHRHQRPALSTNESDHPLGIGVVGVHDRRTTLRQQLLEEAHLGREIGLD